MRVVVSFPGNFMDAQQAARAFHERGALAGFVTGVNFAESGFVRKLCAHLPSGLDERAAKQLRRRTITQVPATKVVCYPWLEMLRIVLAKYVKNPTYADRAWDLLSHRFDRTVARRHLEGVQAVHAFEYTAKYTFEEAANRGVARILAMPSMDSKEVEDIKTLEEARFPELQGRHHRYFAAHFNRRYERRRAETALADVIVANSELTRCSHVKAGVDPEKIVSVPLAAPPAVAEIVKPETDIKRPLSVVWAGNLVIQKGAHYFFDAWRALALGDCGRATAYGAIGLPDRVLRSTPRGLELMGSVPQQDMFAAFEQADVLVFPTLADGFGMVVMEAFSRGLPVITTDKAGASEFVKHGWNGLVISAGDPTVIADALRWCLDNRKELYEMRFRALHTARRWQWPDYRRLLIAKLEQSLCRADFKANFGPEIEKSGLSACLDSFASAS